MITLRLSTAELQLLTALASDELFRREFIDRRIPGAQYEPGEIARGKMLVDRMKQIAAPEMAGRRSLPAVRRPKKLV